MKIAEATSSTVQSLWKGLQGSIAESSHLENAAQSLAAAVHAKFDESVVVARVFVTVPFGELPEANRQFVTSLAKGASAAADLKDDTPVLSLVGTHGQESDWNDRRSSKGHVGIPLISSAFVGAIPMISRLLKELGVPIDWIDSPSTEVIVKTIGSSAGLFFVDDAATARDQEGRKIIAAQDFVKKYGVQSVFGTGGAYPNGQMVTVVVFCREAFARSTAEHFMALTDFFKGSTAALAEPKRVFAA
jgi:hypothetical protein